MSEATEKSKAAAEAEAAEENRATKKTTKKTKERGAEDEPGKRYAKTLKSAAAIWSVLSHAKVPLTSGEIYKRLQGMSSVPIEDTIKRILERDVQAMETLFPSRVFRVYGDLDKKEPLPMDSGDEREMRYFAVEETDPAQLAKKTKKPLVVLEAEKTGPHASLSTITNLLLEMEELGRDKEILKSLPVRVKCLAADDKDDKTKYISYQKALKKAWEKAKAANAAPPRNNVPRRYCLESRLTPYQSRILTNLIKIYPFINQREKEKLLNVLEKVFPGFTYGVGERYAYEIGENRAFFAKLAVLDSSIEAMQHRKVRVEYGEYRLEQGPEGWRPVLKPHKPSDYRPNCDTRSDTDKDALEQERKDNAMTFLPYALMWSNGYYYAVGKRQVPGLEEGRWPMYHLRVDRIMSLKPVQGNTPDCFYTIPSVFDPVEYRNQSPVMYAGEVHYVRLRCHVSLLSALNDFFGSAAKYAKPKDDYTVVTLPQAAVLGVKLIAMEYADRMEVLEPQTLREDVEQALRAGLARYGDTAR